MFKRTKISTGVLLALGGALLVPVASQAQEAQRIEVTGSRIRSVTADSPSPLQVITAQDIAASGAVNVQDLLLKSPTMGSFPTFSRTNSNFDTSNSGVSTIELRSLGEDRTLVLVNGKRFVAGVPGSQAVDLNSIPVDFIERVEVLSGGASSLYGSDAVAGVINIVLKKDYEGLALDASVGQSERGDDKKQKFGITWGANTAGGKGNVMLHFGYSKQGAVYSRDRSQTAVDNISTAFLTGDIADLWDFTTPFLSSFAPQGRVFFDTNGAAAGGATSVTFDQAGNIIPVNTNGAGGATPTGFNRQAFRTIAIPTSRYMLAGKGDFEFAENQRAYIEGTFTTTKTNARLEPFPLDSADSITGIYPATGVGPAEFNINGVIRPNPLIPAALLAQMTDTDGDGLRDYSFSRRLSEVGNRGSRAQTDTFRVASGLKGTLFNKWDYDLYGIYGTNKRVDTSTGQVNVQNFRNALEAVTDVDDLDGDGDTTEAVCIDAQARAQGCVPVNVFGFNSITPEALAYIEAPAFLNTFTTQRIGGVNVSGEPFSLWAGPVGIAAGAEYRKEYSRSEFDALQQAGLNAGNKIPKTEGGFSVKEAFLEARLPLLKDAPFAKALSVSGAVRGSKYTTVGSTFSWNAGAEWALNSTVKFRATRSLSTRAPNISELFQPPTQDFPQVNDPCEGVTAATTGATADACRADPGVAANIAANGAFTLNQADLQGTSGFDRGNPDLQEEEGRSTTIGVVITPTGFAPLRNFTFTADYFKIDIADAIVTTPRQFILSQCYGGDASFCQFVTRRPTAVGANSAGSLQRVDSEFFNGGGISTEGVDLTALWADRVGPGRLSTRLAYTYMKKGSLVPVPGADPDPYAGEVGTPKHKASLGLGYSWGPFGVNGLVTYLGKQYLDDQFLAGFGAAPRSVSIPAKAYLDTQLTYTAGKIQYYFGVDNLFDTHNKYCDTNALIGGENGGCATGNGTFTGDDPIGRRYYIGLRMAL